MMKVELAGQKITTIRPMSPEELQRQGWEPSRFSTPQVIVLENGTKIFASRDDEGNGPGCLWGETKELKGFSL